MRFIVKGGNMKEVVMSADFEELPKTLIVEVVRSSLTQSSMGLTSSGSSTQLTEIPDSMSLLAKVCVFNRCNFLLNCVYSKSSREICLFVCKLCGSF